MFRWYFSLMAILLFQCGSPKHDDAKGTSEDAGFTGEEAIVRAALAEKSLIEQYELWDSTDVFTVTDAQDSVIFDYGTFSIHRLPNGDEVGQTIIFQQGARRVKLSGEASWFKGAIGPFVLLDEGTGTYRTLIVYNSDTGERLTNGYVDGPHFKGSAIWFYDKVDIEDESKRPPCSDELKAIGYGLGYAERQAIDLHGFRLMRTGQFRCQYFE